MRRFSNETYRLRRERVLAELDGSAMVLPAAPRRFASRDSEYPYRPDSELAYLVGVGQPDLIAVLRGDSGPAGLTIFAADSDEKSRLWTGPRPTPSELCEIVGADEAIPLSELETHLPRLLEGVPFVHHRMGLDTRVDRIVLASLSAARVRGPRKGEGPRGLIDPGVILDPMRRVKDADEIARLREAGRMTARAHEAAIRTARPGVGEWELQAEIEHSFRVSGADGPAFETIVGGGENGCVLHYVENRDRIPEGKLALIDAGASLDLYAGDMTRTFPVDGHFSAEQRAVYEVVERAHRAAFDAVSPGCSVADVHGAAVGEIVAGLIDLGVLTGSPEDLILTGAFEPFFPHQTSHYLGLDVHDVGDYQVDGEGVLLDVGVALTVEPGLYFGPNVEGYGASSRFAGIGVRVEDSVLVTQEGAENLTPGVPTDSREIEALVGSGRG